MPDKYHNKYRIPSVRLQSWDYGSNAAYFITICTKNREHFFGEMVGDTMELSTIGLQVEQEWIKTPALRPDMNLELGNFVVMPNHFHGILIIGENIYNTDGGFHGRDAMHCVSTGADPPTDDIVPTGDNPPTDGNVPTGGNPPTDNNAPIGDTAPTDDNVVTDNNAPTDGVPTNNVPTPANQFGPQSKNLASIIRGFKSAVTTFAKINGIFDFAWQPRYHDHIIRNADSFERIQNYIANNPLNWKEDKFNSE
jgi:REP element-mobilizing transposase RayT